LKSLLRKFQGLTGARTMLLLVVVPIAIIFITGCANSPAAHSNGDPSGTGTGTRSDTIGATQGGPQVTTDSSGKVTGDDLQKNKDKEPLAYLLADVVGQNRISANLVWTLVTGFLVMFMQAGFALVETGFTRLKNAGHTMMMNFMVYGLGMLGYFIAGFAFQFGGVGAVASLGGTAPLTGAGGEWVINLFGKPFGLLGTNGFFLAGGTYDVAVAVLFLFQMVFMDTAATIPTGAMAERWKWSGFAVFALFCSTLTYPVFGNWAWGGGWLSQLGANFGLGHGYVDFAGSGVVHAVGGWMGLAGAMVLGPRIGKYNKDGSVNATPGHNLTLAALGTFILAFGWFGFNPGSTLGASGAGLNRIGIIAVDTMLAGAAASFSAMAYTWIRWGKPDPGMMINGLLAGLVAITAPSGFVSPVNSVIIGLIAGVLVIGAVWTFDHIFKVDDPVGAISVHGVCGTWGVLSVGLFADGTANYGGGWNGVTGSVHGLFYGDPGQLVAQLIGAVTCFVYVWGLSYIFFRIVDRVLGMRVTPAVELAGVDIPEMGMIPYPEDWGAPEETPVPPMAPAYP
jgi:Amt family ammonium transporter